MIIPALMRTLVLLVLLTVAHAASAEPRTAIRGYDPVAYFTMGQPLKGEPSISHVWDGTRYLFASTKHRDMFMADPDRYAPQFAGFCTAGLSKGHKVEADPESWTISDGRLFVFFSDRGRAQFVKDPDGTKSKAEANWRQVRRDERAVGE
jgi:YHS domain-containing protein